MGKLIRVYGDEIVSLYRKLETNEQEVVKLLVEMQQEVARLATWSGNAATVFNQKFATRIERLKYIPIGLSNTRILMGNATTSFCGIDRNYAEKLKREVV